MKKLALTALAAVIAATGFVSTASAGSRNNDDEWRRYGDRDGGDRDGGRWDDNQREARRDRDRHDGDEWRRHDRRDHWRRHHHPRYVFRYDRYDRDFCFVKKIRRYDDWGNVYIKRVRICR